MRDIVKDPNALYVMGELWVTYSIREQGYIFYIEICGSRFKILEVYDFDDKVMDRKLTWLWSQGLRVTQCDPEETSIIRFCQQAWVRIPLTPAVMQVVKDLQHFVEKEWKIHWYRERRPIKYKGN